VSVAELPAAVPFPVEHPDVGPIGRLGRFAADHVRAVSITWALVAVALAVFAPKVETALSGAGWQANGSQSVQARTLIQKNFGGLASSAPIVVIHSSNLMANAPAFRATVAKAEAILRSDSRISTVVSPRPGVSISRHGHTALIVAGAKQDPTAMVAAADALKGKLHKLATSKVSVSLTGASGMWSDFNAANRTAMMKSELYSWPVTLAILVLAFGSLVAAGLPLLLTMLGLLASAGLLALLTHGFEISIWAMNFALMFALALGIDYALFVVHRFRGAYFGSRQGVRDAVVVTMDTAGKAVLFSGLTVFVSLSAVMLVPSPAFRSMALGIMLSVAFVLAATLTLLPAVLAKLGPKVDSLSLRWVRSGEHRSRRFARWGEQLWRHPHIYGPVATLILVLLALPVFGLKTGMRRSRSCRRRTALASATRRCSRPSGRARRGRCRSSPRAPKRRRSRPSQSTTPGSHRSHARSPAAAGSRSSRRPRPPTRRAAPPAAPSTAYARRFRPAPSSGAPPPRTTTLSELSRRRRRW
jgi:RND superfamily putative drug exporter